MTFVHIVTATSILLAVLWLPVLLHFFRGWRQRHNPVSLAICGAIALLIYGNIVMGLLYGGHTTLVTVFLLTRLFDLLAVLNFYVAFRWAEKRFADQRNTKTGPRKPTP